MNLLETTILADSVRLRYGNNPDRALATQWLEFQVPLADLTHPVSRGQPQPLGAPEEQFVSEVQLAALRYMRDVIGGETQRLMNIVGRSR